MDISEIRNALENGLLCFPVTDMDAAGHLNVVSYRSRIEWLLEFEPSAVFAPGGTGEFFSLTHEEYKEVVGAAVAAVQGRVPVIASAGRSIGSALMDIEVATAAGADAILLMPPYLTHPPDEGLRMYAEAILKKCPLPVVYYNRAHGILNTSTIATLAEACPNLIGLKDGTSNMQALNLLIKSVGDRLSYIGGAPTAEIVAAAYLGVGVNTYSSAVFNFVPALAKAFYSHLRSGNSEMTDVILRDFFVPFVKLRERKKGYAVSLIKAGAALVGHSAGAVRPPLVMPTTAEVEELRILVNAADQFSNRHVRNP